MPIKNKVFVIVFLSLPLAVTVIGCYRLHKFVEVMNLPKVYAEDPHNVRNVLSNIEANLGVLAACGPTIKWILSRFIPYFETVPNRNACVSDQFPHFRWRTRENSKTGVDIELQEHDNDDKNDDEDDNDSQKQCTTRSSDIRKITMLQREGNETSMVQSGLHSQLVKPKASLQPDNHGFYPTS